ncbi:N-acetylmuramoyl-L-alanine amidase [Macrococcus armenti]|uniref:N-acetylmuramoyl-L-alanine amidase n=1 Tax=Macrococcus armenti TaxID=2875764 RepID=UPI001CD40F4E|nr:N-acetylmuramoyl-L-alanine amidase [Macrococcus armenti]UBH10585.1 SH3 domain-containing protein [Macrococcus armenti]
MAYKIINMWLPSSKYHIKAPFAMNAEYITVHNTGNTASAREEATYHNSNNNEVSFHVVIDEKEAVQVIPFNRNAWHSGDGRGNGNMKSIGVEIARSMDNGYSGPKSQRYMQAEENAAVYIAHVMHEKGWDMSRLRRHYDWSGKDCPHKMHATGTYQQFRDKVQKHLVALNNGKKVQASTVKKPVKKAPAKNTGGWQVNKYGTRWKNEKGTFINGSEPIQAYYVGPFVIAKNKAGKLPAKAKIKYDEVMVQDGYVWVGYNSNDGKRIYLPIRTHKNGVDGPLWGKIK